MPRLSIYGEDAEYRTSTLDLATISSPISIDASLTSCLFADADTDGTVYTISSGFITKRLGNDTPTKLSILGAVQDVIIGSTYIYGASSGNPGSLVRVDKAAFTATSFTVQHTGTCVTSQNHCAFDSNGDVWIPVRRSIGSIVNRGFAAVLTRFDVTNQTFPIAYRYLIDTQPSECFALSISGTTAYASVTHFDDNETRIHKVDLTNGTVLGTIVVGTYLGSGSTGTAVHSRIIGNNLYVATVNDLHKIALSDFTLTTTLNAATDRVIGSNGVDTLWLADNGTLRRVDIASMTVTATASGYGNDGRLIVYEPDPPVPPIVPSNWVVGAVGW